MMWESCGPFCQGRKGWVEAWLYYQKMTSGPNSPPFVVLFIFLLLQEKNNIMSIKIIIIIPVHCLPDGGRKEKSDFDIGKNRI